MSVCFSDSLGVDLTGTFLQKWSPKFKKKNRKLCIWNMSPGTLCHKESLKMLCEYNYLYVVGHVHHVHESNNLNPRYKSVGYYERHRHLLHDTRSNLDLLAEMPEV